MKIIYIGAFRFPTYDAAAARVLNIGRTLRMSGHDVTFIAWGGKYDHNVSDHEGDIYDGFRYYISGELNERNILKKTRNKFFSGLDSIKIFKRLIPDTDIVIAYNPDFYFNRRLVSICKTHRIKYIVDITEWFDNKEIKIVDILPNWFNMTYFNRHMVKNMILISSYLGHFYSSNHKIIIPPTCNREDTKWEIPKTKKSDCQPISLIYAGTPARKDKLHCIINAVESIQEAHPGKIRLLILGIDKATYLTKYHNLINTSNLSEAVQFFGRVNQDDVPRYYAMADFMVLLRDSTRKSNAGFPTKFAESMMAGTPVIANLTSDLNSYLKDGYNGFVVDQPSAGSLTTLLMNKVLPLGQSDLAKLHEHALQIGYKYFNYSEYTAKLDRFIHNLL